MVKIKGPIKISGGFNAREFMEKNMKDIKMKLPFTATGWKSAKNSDLVDGGSAKVEEEKPTKKSKRRGK